MRGARLYRAAADAGDVSALYNLGVACRRGDGDGSGGGEEEEEGQVVLEEGGEGEAKGEEGRGDPVNLDGVLSENFHFPFSRTP